MVSMDGCPWRAANAASAARTMSWQTPLRHLPVEQEVSEVQGAQRFEVQRPVMQSESLKQASLR